MTETNDLAAAPLAADLSEAAGALEAFANGPAKRAGEAIETAFAKAGRSIESELSRAAKSGEADLDRLARAIIETLAKLAAERIGGGAPADTVRPLNLTMNISGPAVGQGADGASSANQIAAVVARAVMRGARFT